jgi:putative MATE family efflux protein
MASASTPRPNHNPLLSDPILPTLLRLAAPNVLAMTMAVAVGVAETWYIGRLGTGPLAAMALVFPFNMLTQMLSSGAMGGGVSSAVSRALGAGDDARARTLAFHATVIGAVAGLIYTAVFLLFGPAIYAMLGGQGQVLADAVAYGGTLFCGASLVWLMNALASVVRGTGNMRVPSVTILLTSALQIGVGGMLCLGWGPVPAMGLQGIAIGNIVASGAGTAFLLWYMLTGQGRLNLHLKGVALQRGMFSDILKVGALACLSPLQSVLTTLIFTGFIARLGTEALAGYGIGQRLEFMLIPIAFGIGVAAVPMVGMAIGAAQVPRARRVAWIAGSVSALNLGVVGAIVTWMPDLWSGLFTNDAQVLASASQYLNYAGPAFPLFGFGLTLYFASQGSGKVLGPVMAASLRLILVIAVGSWLATFSHPEAWHYYALVAAAMLTYGLATALAIWLTPWGKK